MKKLLIPILCLLLASLAEAQRGPTMMASRVVKTTSANVGTSSIVAFPKNPQRLAFYLYNNSSNSVYVTFGPTSVAATCTWTVPTFATWIHNYPVGYTGEISAIRNAGSGTLTLYELQ